MHLGLGHFWSIPRPSGWFCLLLGWERDTLLPFAAPLTATPGDPPSLLFSLLTWKAWRPFDLLWWRLLAASARNTSRSLCQHRTPEHPCLVQHSSL